MNIKVASSDMDLRRCFPVMFQLRPQLIESEFVDKVKHQQKTGYSLVYLEENNTVIAIAGFRLIENLSNGKLLYVDDLITKSSERSKGYGSVLFDWLFAYAKSINCLSFQLDSGVQRGEAHRFYFRKGMTISSYHFKLACNHA